MMRMGSGERCHHGDHGVTSDCFHPLMDGLSCFGVTHSKSGDFLSIGMRSQYSRYTGTCHILLAQVPNQVKRSFSARASC